MANAPIIEVALQDGPVKASPFDPFPQPAGAECVFFGRTRNEAHETHGRLIRLSYEAYAPMAEKVLREIAEEAAARFGCLAVRVLHATGHVPPGEASVVVQVVAGHRSESFEACRFVIDELKKRAPIWKKEEWEDGATWSQGSPVAPTSQDQQEIEAR